MPMKIIKIATQVVFDDMIADIISNEKLNQVVTELFLRRSKLNIATVFITQTYFPVEKDVRLSCTYFFYYENSKQRRASANRN